MRARGPSAPACGLRPGGASRGRVAPDGRGLGRGAAGEAVRRPRAERGPDAPAAAVATSRSEGGSSLLPLAAGQRAPFPLPPPPPAPGRAELSARAPGGGTWAPRALPGPPRRCHDEWAGGARPGRKRAPPARSAKRVGTRPGRPGSQAALWGRGGQAGVRASSGASGKLQGPLPRLQFINGRLGW